MNTNRGFGIDATTPLAIALEGAALAERSGYGSFWVNGSPHGAALDVIENVLERTGLDVGVGVFALPKFPADAIVSEVVERQLDQDRIWLGIGSGRRPGALAEVREGARHLRESLDVAVVTGAVGPKMTALAAEVADGLVLTWSFAAEAERSREIVEARAAELGRNPPTLISFVRCALLPGAASAVAERAATYDAIPHYREIFERNGLSAADTVVTGTSRKELIAGIEHEESVLDMSVIRAIPADDTLHSLAELVRACAP